MPETTKVSRRLRLPSLLSLAMLLLVVPLSMAACSDDDIDTTPSTTATGEATSGVNGNTPTAEDVVIELTDDGFTPDRVEIRAGTRVILSNATDSDRAVVVNGRASTGGNGITIGGGESVELDLQDLGAYVLTLADDPQTTASVVIS